MRLWRITRPEYADALSGEGARLYGGRWTRPGRPALYTARSVSLCLLEALVHMDPGQAPEHLVAHALDVPDELAIEKIPPARLPTGWRRYPAPEFVKDIGTAWLERASSAVLEVPSAVVPIECCFVLNPQHPDFVLISVHSQDSFEVDPRLLAH